MSQMGAVSVVFPIVQIVIGLGMMFGAGASSYISDDRAVLWIVAFQLLFDFLTNNFLAFLQFGGTGSAIL